MTCLDIVIIKMNLKKFIFYHNDNYLAVNKPANLSTLEDRNSDISLLQLARETFGYARVCHRLDKDTTGVIIIARNDEAYRNLTLQFQERKVRKIYHAIVHGRGDFRNLEINMPIFIPGSGKVRIDKRAGKGAITHLNTLDVYKDYTLVSCQPASGRKHQIRVHLASIDHPIVGDVVYGGQPVYLSSLKKNFNFKNRAESPMINRMALHAFQIAFTDVDGSSISLEADYPKDFKVFQRQLKKYGS